MHKSVMEWVQTQVEAHSLNRPGLSVLEVGSYDVNGTVRELFTDVDLYIGVDFREGPGVDRVLDAHDLNIFTNRMFDVVISTEMLEHDSEFWTSMREMGRVLKPEGILIITARGNGFPEHDYPGDYFRFMPQSFYLLLKLAGCEVLSVVPDPLAGHSGVFGIGKKVDNRIPPTQKRYFNREDL